MEKLCRLKIGKDFRIENCKIAFGDDVYLAHGNKLFCFNSEGVLWNWKMHATFYRDPYEDVSITALDANQFYVLAGTNFMDGKAYLFSSKGKLLWMHQFATIASLGWRPEDVTFVRLNGQFVIIGTEFMNEYVHVYTTDRKRIFQNRVNGKVEDAFLIKNTLFVGTENFVYLFNIANGLNYSIKTPAKKIVVFDDRILVLNDKGIFVYKFEGEYNLKEYWNVRLQNPVFCTIEKDVVLASENLLNYVSSDGEVIWQKMVDGKIEKLFYDEWSSKIYVGTENCIYVYSLNGEYDERLEFEGNLLEIGGVNDSLMIVTYDSDIVNFIKVK